MIFIIKGFRTIVYNNKDEYDNNHPASSQKFGQLISSVEITIKMKTIVRKPLMIKNNLLYPNIHSFT